MPSTIRQAITDRVESTGFGVRELARAAQMNPSQLSRYIRGGADLRGQSIDRLLDALGLHVAPRPGRPPKR